MRRLSRCQWDECLHCTWGNLHWTSRLFCFSHFEEIFIFTLKMKAVVDAFKGIETVDAYADWMSKLGEMMPGCTYTVKSLTWNPTKQVVVCTKKDEKVQKEDIEDERLQDVSHQIYIHVVLCHLPRKARRRLGGIPCDK
jgi:hypothetical protein